MAELSGGTTDPKGLEGRPEVTEGSNLRPREFFWDSIVLYVVSVIVGLAAIDALTEYIRDSDVECFSPASNGSVKDISGVQEYVNSFCAGSLPVGQYLPVFIVVHGILIAIPHYLWLNHFGGSLDFFFQLASSLERLRDERTGEYPERNTVIVEQLESAFTTYKRNGMFHLYIGKLLLQWLLTAGGIVLAVAYLTDFDSSFFCPRTVDETLDEVWPFPNDRVICVFTSLRLLSLIRIADIILLALAILGLTWSLIWCASTHATELGYQQVAQFSFQSSLPPRYYVPKFPVPRCCTSFRNTLHKFFISVPWLSFHGPRIGNDLDFLTMKLFRTDGGLGHVLKEVFVLKEITNLNEDERRKLGLHKRELTSKKQLIGKEVVKAGDLKWQFDTGSDLPWQPFKSDKEVLVLPDSIRGAVLGLASYAPKNVGAVIVSFGSPSVAFANALGRVFQRVGFINLNPYYRNSDERIHLEADTMDIVTVLCPENVLTGDGYTEFLQTVRELWMPGITYDEFDSSEDEVQKTDFILIGPINSDLQKTTVNLFLDLVEEYISEDAILVTVRPLKIAGKDTSSEFKEYSPPEKYFEEFKHKATRTLNSDSELQWPPKPSQSSSTHTAISPSNRATPPSTTPPSAQSSSATVPLVQQAASPRASSGPLSKETEQTNCSELSLQVGNSHSKFRFTLSKRITVAAAIPQDRKDTHDDSTSPMGATSPALPLHTKVLNSEQPQHQIVTVEHTSF